ncbi:hypothetical protein FRC07_008397 [Ceratobasidium sp. 392]|nr:hypothetical protein FRC07_008397 [Ceratobasidium sp. 392]
MSKTLAKDQMLLNIAYHVFLPPKLPQQASTEDIERHINHRLASLIVGSINQYRQKFPDATEEWGRMSSVLSKFSQTLEIPLEKHSLGKDMTDMRAGDILVLYIHEQNAAVIIRKSSSSTTFEIFEAQAASASVMSTPGKIVRHFPGPAIEIPNSVVNEPGFVAEIANFLAQMSVDALSGATAKTTKAGSRVAETRDPADPHYISQLFTGILRGFGKEVEPRRVVKRVADEVLWDNAYLPWRRSPVWLIIRVTLQTWLNPVEYKNFIAYFHAYLLGLCSRDPSFSSDTLSAMRAKMAHRLLKIEGSAPDILIQVAKDASQQTEAVLQARWAVIQAKAPQFGPLDLNLYQAVFQSLPNSRRYLSQVLQGRSRRSKPPPFNPLHTTAFIETSNFSLFADGALARSFGEHKHDALFHFENAVHNRLSTWISESARRTSQNPCAVISSCLEQYTKAALSHYTQDKADSSIMILTIVELWVGLDRLVTSQHNILLNYSPEIPDSLLEGLLLRSSLHLERARSIQIYLRGRHENASRGSVFSSKQDRNSLPVFFFSRSHALQELKRTIEQDARGKYDAKIKELEKLNAEHARLKQTASQIECTYRVNKKGARKHNNDCRRCTMQRQANKMKIAVYEWPLPARQFDAEAAVFELQCPEEISIWRDMTHKILCDLGGATEAGGATHYGTPAEYEGLRKWAGSSKRRVTLTSSTKSFRHSHYAETKIPATGDAVCVNNGLTFKLFDSNRSAWVPESFEKANFSTYGTFILPKDSSYRYLQFSLEGTSHTSNQIIANQSDCPRSISLHEHYAFGTLRSGARLQWMNMVRGLEENLLTFNRSEVYILHTQAAWQLGPLSTDGRVREWHLELNDPVFGRLLVSQACRVLDRARANWLESTTVHTAIMLVARLLSTITDPATHQAAYSFLRDARSVTTGWLEELLIKLQNSELDSQDFKQRVCEMALACRSTYDVDNHHLLQLVSNPADWIAFIFCSIALFQNLPPKVDSAPQHLQVLLSRDRRLSLKTLPILLIIALAIMDGLYSQAQVLAGSQLTQVLDVVPTSSAGMMFATRTPVNGHQVAFSLDASNELIVQASRSNITYELVPHSKLLDDFPVLFSLEYYHWMNLKTGTVEFRPIEKPWISDKRNWNLYFSQNSTSRMEKTTESGQVSLFDMHNLEFQKIANQLAPLESLRYLHVARSNSSTPSITAELPRMKLVFFLNKDGQLESQNFGGQIVDQMQSSGTMFGLKDQLILCPKSTIAKSLPQARSVLIPYGSIEFALGVHHTQVSIDRGSERHVTFYQYKVDIDMGYLANVNASLTSRLFKIYLHALTSHCLPDPLTGRTGTEEALQELSESATTSFDQINMDQAQLLQLIGGLTPKRTYYPAHLKVMQTTKWANLPSLAQHYAFSTIVNSVLTRAQALRLFSPPTFNLDAYMVLREQNLIKRAAYRTRRCYPVDSVCLSSIASDNYHHEDYWYDGKDHLSSGWTECGQLASWVSGLLHRNWDQPIHAAYNLLSQFEKWSVTQGPLDDFQVTYSQEWLGLNLPSAWLSIYNICRTVELSSAQYGLVLCLATGIYSGWLSSELVPVFLSFANNPQFRPLAPPGHSTYQLSDKYLPTTDRVLMLIDNHCRAIENTPSNSIAKEKGESKSALKKRQKVDYDTNLASLKPQLAQYWVNSWPHNLSAPSGVFSSWFNVKNLLLEVQSYFNSCSRNVDLRDHLQQVERALSSGPATPSIRYSKMPRALRKPSGQESHPIYPIKSLQFDQLARRRAPCVLLNASEAQSSVQVLSTQGNPPNTTQLESLLGQLYKASNRPLPRRYVLDLEASRTDLVQAPNRGLLNHLPPLSQLESNRALSQLCLCKNIEAIHQWLGPITELDHVASLSGLWPRLTTRAILKKLSLQARRNLPMNCQAELVKFARAYVEYQRSQRLINLALDEKCEEFYKELTLASTSSGAGASDPDWLLVQIDGNFSIRTTQAQVTHEMISPSSSSNTVLQLNMGEGKSSAVVPIAAAALADTTRLVRVVVLKPLWRQMFHLLVSRLSGLVDRRVYYLPFGRHVRVGELQAKQIQGMYEECMREGGVLLVQPEHILSFKLMGIDHLLSSSSAAQVSAAKNLRWTQNWLFEHARDILDESDEILHVRYQLVYTLGEQQPLEGHPDRWTTTQQVLSLVAGHIKQLKQKPEYYDKLKYDDRAGGQFPLLRIMPESDQVVAQLVRSVAEDSVSGFVPNLNFSLLPKAARSAALRFLTSRSISSQDVWILSELDPSLRSGLLLLRGLLAYGILAFALRDKHYRIDYGLHVTRTLLAVPYHAKDTPSPRAEFGHPDVAILLTCLSYYNNGLTERQLNTCFELVLKLDDPDLEYDQWVRRNEATPPILRQLSGVNLKDHDQFTNYIIPTFSRNAAVVDFFLSSVVFPKHAKQFPYKLSASGWDLAETKAQVTTGFSGTNDNRYLLPSSIAQTDPVKQSATNALVLTYLLQPENNHYLCIRGANGETCSAKEFLNMLVNQDPEIRVLLDVGAQMLEMTNHELVEYWLRLRSDVAAAVYFNDQDELLILPQNGSPTLFHTSPFAQQMDKCVVYLDDSHTRGTDLKLPAGTRAAVTLGPKVTKDRLIQDTQIRKIANLANKDQVNTLNVIRWTMLETCKDLEHHISHWAQQGVEYGRRADARQIFDTTTNVEVIKRGWLTSESRSLEEMYGGNSSASGSFISTAFRIPSLRRQLEYLGIKQLEDTSMNEEQEKEQEKEQEASHEMERQRQVQRPAKLHAATHWVHPGVQRFVQTGQIPQSWSGIVSLFQPLKTSGILQPGIWSPKLFASLDFCKALKTSTETQLSEYMRPLNWVLSGPNRVLLVLSPYEADQLLPEIRKSTCVRLHMFAPRVVQSMLSFSALKFYSPPSLVRPSFTSPELLLQVQLSLFAGQLYFDDYTQYRTVCGFLGIFISTDATREADIRVQSDGFVAKLDRQVLASFAPEYRACSFNDCPIAALKDLMSHRRKGMDFSKTHLGQMLHARQLTPSDF